MKTLLTEIKTMNQIAGTQMTRQQEIALIKERLEQLNEGESFVKKMEKVNPNWSKEKLIKDIEKEYQKKEITKEQYKQYIKKAETWFDKMQKNGPTVKIGDFVIVNPKKEKLKTLGKIVGETNWEGYYMYMGNPMPKKVPSWKVELYGNKNLGYFKKEPIMYGGKKYYKFGERPYYQCEEGETFEKIKTK